MRPDPQETADLVTFTEEILNGNLHFLCSASICLTSSGMWINYFTDFTKKHIKSFLVKILMLIFSFDFELRSYFSYTAGFTFNMYMDI